MNEDRALALRRLLDRMEAKSAGSEQPTKGLFIMPREDRPIDEELESLAETASMLRDLDLRPSDGFRHRMHQHFASGDFEAQMHSRSGAEGRSARSLLFGAGPRAQFIRERLVEGWRSVAGPRFALSSVAMLLVMVLILSQTQYAAADGRIAQMLEPIRRIGQGIGDGLLKGAQSILGDDLSLGQDHPDGAGNITRDEHSDHTMSDMDSGMAGPRGKEPNQAEESDKSDSQGRSNLEEPLQANALPTKVRRQRQRPLYAALAESGNGLAIRSTMPAPSSTPAPLGANPDLLPSIPPQAPTVAAIESTAIPSTQESPDPGSGSDPDPKQKEKKKKKKTPTATQTATQAADAMATLTASPSLTPSQSPTHIPLPSATHTEISPRSLRRSQAQPSCRVRASLPHRLGHPSQPL